jgi:hypothetical protein
VGSANRGILFALDKADSPSAGSDRIKTVHPPAFPSRSGSAQIQIFLFSPKHRAKPVPKGPNQDLIRAVVDMKQRNPIWGCPRIGGQIELAFGVSLNKDVVRRILAAHYHPSADGSGPSWLTFIGHAKDSLHSIDLFRCESAVLRTY